MKQKKSLILVILLLIISISIILDFQLNNTKNELNEKIFSKRELNNYYVIDKLIENFNSKSINQINDIINVNIQDKEYYKTEFRLNAFENALAKKGIIGSSDILVINYYINNNKVDEPKNLRIYLSSNNENEFENILVILFDILDESISNDDILTIVNEKKYGYSSVIGKKNISYFINFKDNKYTLMIDLDNKDINFIN